MPGTRTHRLLVLGANQVGKTAIIEQLLFENHVVGHGGRPTIGDIYEVSIETEKGTNEKLQIFDTPGSLFASSRNSSEQEHYLSIADGVVLVYDVTSKPSYDVVVNLRPKVTARNKDLPMVVLGNKIDQSAMSVVPTTKSSQWARSYGIRPFEVTVLNRDSLKEPFSYIAWRMGNPGKPSSVIPLLASAALPIPYASHTPSSEAKPLHDATPLHSPDSVDSAVSAQNLVPCYHDDSHYPSGKGAFFFADCLSSKNKAHFKGQD